ncbi:unnamed protein product [Amoebophrya sp. A25]|nr:unnamed protein product [Amoebophrya sp. A25]|eukprot:GSA25T00022584001.1
MEDSTCDLDDDSSFGKEDSSCSDNESESSGGDDDSDEAEITCEKGESTPALSGGTARVAGNEISGLASWENAAATDDFAEASPKRNKTSFSRDTRNSVLRTRRERENGLNASQDTQEDTAARKNVAASKTILAPYYAEELQRGQKSANQQRGSHVVRRRPVLRGKYSLEDLLSGGSEDSSLSDCSASDDSSDDSWEDAMPLVVPDQDAGVLNSSSLRRKPVSLQQSSSDADPENM